MRHHQSVLWGSGFTRSQRRKSRNSRPNSAAGLNPRREDGAFEPLSPLVATSRLSPIEPEQPEQEKEKRLHRPQTAWYVAGGDVRAKRFDMALLSIAVSRFN
jgi:hypothetical protein